MTAINITVGPRFIPGYSGKKILSGKSGEIYAGGPAVQFFNKITCGYYMKYPCMAACRAVMGSTSVTITLAPREASAAADPLPTSPYPTTTTTLPAIITSGGGGCQSIGGAYENGVIGVIWMGL